MVAASKKPPTNDKPADDATEPGNKQQALQIAGVPQRNEELEKAGVRLANAKEAKVNAEDQRKAAYNEIKEIMRAQNLPEYVMFDIKKTLKMKSRDAEIIMEDTETGSSD